MTTALAWIATAITFAVADFLWLSQAAQKIYRPMIGDLLADQFNLAPAIAFYLIYVSGIVFFAVSPALERGSLQTALINGAVLGFVAYATFDLSNQAVMRVWDTRMTVIDMAWGTFATALAAGVAYAVTMRFSPP